jgi:hypothetical protein
VEEVREDWRKLRNEDIHNFSSAPHITIKFIKSSSIICHEQSVCMEGDGNGYNIVACSMVDMQQADKHPFLCNGRGIVGL